MSAIITVDKVSKNFTNHRALDAVSMEVPEGTIYGLLGPNGAGKTTLIRIINHITAPDSGTVDFMGHRLTAADVNQIGYLPEERGLYKKMKVGEQALFLSRLKGLSKAEAKHRLTEWFERFGIMDWWGKKVEELSKGMAQKVQFIVTVLHRPKLLIFDEPFSGFDPINANLLKDEILKLKSEGSTVIFSTHNMSSVEEICDNITLINKGRNVLSGNVEALRKQYFRNSFVMEFGGVDTEPLRLALGDMIERLEVIEPGKVALTVGDGHTLREVIERANPAVEIRSLTPQMASMNDIFIKVVENGQD